MDTKGAEVNILIVKLSAIGDVIHTLPSLSALRKLYPAAHITWVVEEAAAGLVLNHPLLDEVLISRRKTWLKKIKAGKFQSAWDDIYLFFKALRRRPYDLVIDFHGLFKSSVIVFLSGGKRKLGYDSMQELSGLFLTEKIPEDMNKHAVERYLDFPRHLGAQIEKTEFVLPSDADADKQIDLFMEKHLLEEGKFIAINPIAYWKTKLWKEEKFAVLADLISEKLKMKVVFTGSKKAPLDKIISKMSKSAVNLGGQTSLPQLAAFLKKAKMLVTTDSGPMHLAAAVGTPVIALFGPTDPARTGPYGEGHTIIKSALTCSPCFLKKCSTGQCMNDITTEHVFAVLEKRIKS
ncbi:MAG TPA: lipopolysaccharide heptosyltransferase II [Deltaproteobacteria bacterium]|nr:lipopolysaccharide heptosyltransferase II [Deltaproteobacteria bacterium]